MRAISARLHWSLAAITVAAVLGAAPAPASAALLKTVTAGSFTYTAGIATTNVTLPAGTSLSKSFVVCSTRTSNTLSSTANATCQLNAGGAGGATQLTITAGANPGVNALVVQYYVAEFAGGVSVQRGASSFSGTSTTPITVSPTGVDCTKSVVIGSTRSTVGNATNDEASMIQAVLACPTSTTTTLTLSRGDAGAAATSVTYEWQVVTMEGASVQRGTSCIGSVATCGAVPGGFTQGLNNRITLATGVDTSKSIVLLTTSGGTALGGIEGEWRVRGEFTATGTAQTFVQFVRSVTSTTANHHVNIAYEVVSFNDGSSVLGSGAAPITVTTATQNQTIGTIDVTRSVLFFSISGGDAGATGRIDDTSVTAALVGSDGAAGSRVTFQRINTVVNPTVAGGVVSFFRCSSVSGIAHDTVCTLGASTAGNQGAVGWTSTNTVVIVRNTSSTAGNPTNGTNYCTNAGAGCTTTIGGSPVVYPSVVTPPSTDTSFTESGLTTSPTTTYFYKVWARVPTAVGSCTVAPCYVAGTEVTITPRVGANTWSAVVSASGSALNPVTPNSSGAVSLGSNAGKMVTLNATTGAFASPPVSTTGVNQGYLTVVDVTGGEAVIGADSSGFVYSANPATGAVNWVTKLAADAIIAAPTVYMRAFFSGAMAATYPGGYDLVFFATSNNTATGGFTNNGIIALRSDTGAQVWTFAPGALDQILGQPALDYGRDRLYFTSRNGQFGSQQSLWIINVAVSPATLVVSFSGTNNDFTTAPSQSFDGNLLFGGDEAGKLHVVDLTASPPTRTTPYLGSSAFRGFVWEDFNTPGVLYFVTADGFVNALATPTSSTTAWQVKPSGTGTVNQLLPGEFSLWAGGSDGILYQLNVGTGVTEKTFTVGDGTTALGPVSSGSISELFVTTNDGRVYKLLLTNQSLP